MGKSYIELDEVRGVISFHHGGICLSESKNHAEGYSESRGGVFTPRLSVDDARELSDFANKSGRYKNIEHRCTTRVAEWRKGFEARVK